MGRETTRKRIASDYICYGAGYCDLQCLLRYQARDYYTCGVYGWNFDVFTFGHHAVTTGYRGMIHHVDRQFKLEEIYEQKAREIQANRELSYDQQKEQTKKLLNEFLQKVFSTDKDFTIYM